MLDLTDLTYKATAEVNSLSRGMQQRLSIARVLLHDPKVLLMDEPASGLDPRARIEIRELLKELKRMGKTIIISSHILPELGELCNVVGIIERGTLLFSGSVSRGACRARVGQVIHIAVADRAEEEAKAGGRAGRREGRCGSAGQRLSVGSHAHPRDLRGRQGRNYTDLPNILVNKGFRIRSFTEEAINLETAFMRLTKGMVQ